MHPACNTEAHAHEIRSRETSVDMPLGSNCVLQSMHGGQGRCTFDYASSKRHDQVRLTDDAITQNAWPTHAESHT